MKSDQNERTQAGEPQTPDSQSGVDGGRTSEVLMPQMGHLGFLFLKRKVTKNPQFCTRLKARMASSL